MSSEANPTLMAARGVTDSEDRLLTADEPLAELHERCGGTIPGTLAVPELLGLVRQGRQMGLRIAREFVAFDGDELVSGFVRIHPVGQGGDGGCEILVENWNRTALPDENAVEAAERSDAIDRASAEITARLDSQQRVQLMSAQVADGIELHDAVKRNPGRPWTEYVDLVGVAHHQPLHWRLLDETRCVVPGSSRDWRVRLLPVGPANSSPRGFELLLIANEPFNKSYASEQQLTDDQASENMVGSTLTPVLRQPIARIIANAETIRSKLAGPLRSEYSEYAGNIASAGKHLSTMLDDLADLEVVEAPDFSTLNETVDLGDAARRAAGILGVRAHASEISLIVPDERVVANATGEFRRVLQILINLIGNAIAYSPQGSTVEVTVETRLDHTIDVRVSDQGPGIDAELAQKVFDKFERLGRDNDGGSGLGLYISRKLARAMGGELSLNSQASDGAEFVLTLNQAE
ncbi:MAG: HAMP domain-containing sensor histidine kinase [Pseudomonadota bacterium]